MGFECAPDEITQTLTVAFAFTRAVDDHEVGPNIKIHYTCGYSENAIAHNGRLAAGVLLLSKYYRRIELARMLRAALDGEAAPHV